MKVIPKAAGCDRVISKSWTACIPSLVAGAALLLMVIILLALSSSAFEGEGRGRGRRGGEGEGTKFSRPDNRRQRQPILSRLAML